MKVFFFKKGISKAIEAGDETNGQRSA